MFDKILIANRGEIACRIMRTAQAMGVRCVAVYSDADRGSTHVAMADEAYHIGPASPRDSYLHIDNIIKVAKQSSAQAVHPGYGFLSENPAFVEACLTASIAFIGPPASAIKAMGLKDAAKKLMLKAGVPVLPGYNEPDQDASVLADAADRIGYPLMIKARAGGGGRGMRLVKSPRGFEAALSSAKQEAMNGFGDDHVIIEKYIAQARHIELQIFGDSYGDVVHMFERDCSLQRRHQKVIEEAPAPGMTDDLRASMGETAIKAAKAVGYIGAGTVEFIVDGSSGLKPDAFWFMEMNTRLQVEHGVSEAITGLDLVEWQLRVAAGEPMPLAQDQISLTGHAIEARLYAEDPPNNFMPSTGTITHLVLPSNDVRIDKGVLVGDQISPFYDSMIAKLIVHGRCRRQAIAKLDQALTQCQIAGCKTNISFLGKLVRNHKITAGNVDTGLIEDDLDSLLHVPPPSDGALAVAALHYLGLLTGVSLGLEPPREYVDPWQALTGWRAWSRASCEIRLLCCDQSYQIDVGIIHPAKFAVTIDDHCFAISILQFLADDQSETVRVEINNTIIDVVTVPNISTRPLPATGLKRQGSGHHPLQSLQLFCQGHSWQLTLDKVDDNAILTSSNAQQADGQIRAPLTGVVKEVPVREGSSVKQDDTLVVMEAMKMQHVLVAPHDGVVVELAVSAGDQVQDGTLMLRLTAVGTRLNEKD